MLNLFKTFNPQTIILLIGFSFLLKFGYILHPGSLYIPDNSWGTDFLLQPLQKSIGPDSYLWFILAQISIILQALVINRLATEYKLYPIDSFIPAALFIMVSTLYPAWNVLSAPMLASWPILIAINNMLRLHITQSPRKLLFNSGILVTIAGILYLPSIIFALFIVWALVIRKTLSLSDILILILGLITPLYFVAIGLYLSDAPWQSLSISKMGLIDLEIFMYDPKFVVSGLFILLLLLAGTINLNHQMDKNVEAIKKNWWIVIASLIVATLFIGIQVNAEQAFGYVFLMPATLIMAALWTAERSKWLKILAFWLMIAAIICLQYF